MGEKDAATRAWIESVTSSGKDATAGDALAGGMFHEVAVQGLQVVHVGGGRAICSLRVPPHLVDEEGRWRAGSIAAAIDVAGAAAIMTVVGFVKISVDFSISFFSPAKLQEEVEITARVAGHGDAEGKMTAVVVEVKKKASGELVAVGRQWTAFSARVHRSGGPWEKSRGAAAAVALALAEAVRNKL